MIKPIVKGTKVVFGPCRLSYTHLFQKYAPTGNDSEAKYMTNVLIPKGEEETVNALKKAIAEAKRAGVLSKWGGREPKKVDNPLKEGDEKDDPVYNGHFHVNAKCKTRPGVVDRDRQPIMDEEEIYSGVWAVVSVTFFPYDVSGNKGIACGLNNVMKFKDGEPLGGRSSASADFGGVDFGDCLSDYADDDL